MKDISVILSEQVEHFLFSIKGIADIGKLHPLRSRFGGFPVFVKDKNLFYEQVNLEERIENSIWRYLVNGVLKELFSDERCQGLGIQCEWRYIHPQMAYSYVEEIEKQFPIEFVIISNGKRTGYRYTNLYGRAERIKKIFDNAQIDRLVILDFSSPELSTFVHENGILSLEHVMRTSRQTIEEFFSLYFSPEEYRTYLTGVQEAVQEAYEYAGLQTIPNLSAQYLPRFIETVKEGIKNNRVSGNTYHIIKPFQNLKREQRTKLNDRNNIITATDVALMEQNFYDNQRFLSLCGTEPYARSFITSEYLYSTLSKNSIFDYTAIVTGYLKSIEQLLDRFMRLSLQQTQGTLWIKKNGKRGIDNSQLNNNVNGRSAIHVRFVQNNQSYFDTAFASLVNLLDDNKNGWAISPGAVNRITTYLSIYCDECRNQHFHKDNISNIHEVETIRYNTYLLLFWLIGGFRISNSNEEVKAILGIPDMTYDNFYWAVRKTSSGGSYFIISFAQQTPALVAMPMHQEEAKINEYGQLVDTSLRFIRIHRDDAAGWENDDWHMIEEDTASEDVILVTPEHMPDSLIQINKMNGERTPITW